MENCTHPPDMLEEARKLLGLVTEQGEVVVGVQFLGYDCDCAPMNYGNEVELTLRHGPYGDATARTVFGSLDQEGFNGTQSAPAGVDRETIGFDMDVEISIPT